MWGDKKDMLLTRSVFLYFFSPRHSGSKKSFAPLGGLPNQPSGSASRTGSHVGRSKALRCTLSHFTRTWPVFLRVRLRVCVFPPVWKLVEHLKVGKTWMDDATEPKVTIDWNKKNSCFMSRQKKATLKRKKNKMTRVGMSFYVFSLASQMPPRGISGFMSEDQSADNFWSAWKARHVAHVQEVVVFCHKLRRSLISVQVHAWRRDGQFFPHFESFVTQLSSAHLCHTPAKNYSAALFFCGFKEGERRSAGKGVNEPWIFYFLGWGCFWKVPSHGTMRDAVRQHKTRAC